MTDSLYPFPFPATIDPASLGRVVVLMGGHSSERNVSLESGRNVLEALKSRGVDAEGFVLTCTRIPCSTLKFRIKPRERP